MRLGVRRRGRRDRVAVLAARLVANHPQQFARILREMAEAEARQVEPYEAELVVAILHRTAADGGTSTSGDGGTSTSGDRGTSTSGYRGTSTSGDGGTVCIRRWHFEAQRYRLVVGYIGEDGLLPGVAYRLNAEHKLVPAEPASGVR